MEIVPGVKHPEGTLGGVAGRGTSAEAEDCRATGSGTGPMGSEGGGRWCALGRSGVVEILA